MLNLQIKPHPIIAHWVPGVVVVVAGLLAYKDWKVACVLDTFAKTASAATVSVLVLSVFAFVVGEILDSYRDCREEEKELNWDFFFSGDPPKIDRLIESYFTYYVLNTNLSSAILIALIIFLSHPPDWAQWWSLSVHEVGAAILVVVLAAVSIVLLRCDARTLRKAIVEHTKSDRAK
jgi:hypothetical protein